MLNNLVLLNGNSKFQEIHIVINGFMSDEKEDYEAKDWKNGLKNILDKDEQKYIFKWDSGLDYSKLRNHRPFKNGLDFEIKRVKHILETYENIAENSPLLSTKLNFLLTLPASFSSYIVQEWKTSNTNSIKYGKILANEIEYLINRDKKIYLYAHSLGTNLVKNSLLELANKNISVEKVHLFGGATSTAGTYEWKNASETVKYGIHNFYSQKDSVLKYLYKTFELGDTPIGLSPISSNCRNIKNYDVSSIVNGHFEYKENLSKILKII
ncbi:TMCO4 family protein [Aliarcobacter butzleri]|uniref:DUF726 domain-containing protein n=1 Tax=Aliarcobacter butzleri TaxID=28197 RepID=UPI001EDBF188|nr:DUF726 domain-containing protein [Aliarcobacter butzleri]MCG3650978.1 TMCO4 family protein [Aliarcobacter butzleri]